MTDFRPEHHTHDPLLLAAHAAGDLTGPERDDAARLVTDCPDCRALHLDLRAIAAATSELPAPARRRDFSLTPDDAARLRRRSWRTILAPLAGPRFGLARPLGAVFTTLGLAGMLLVALPGGFTFGGVATMPAAAPGAGGPTGEAEPLTGEVDVHGDRTTSAPAAPAGRDEDLDTAQGYGSGSGSGAGDAGTPAAEQPDAALAQRTADTTLAILSGSFLIVGLGLFGLRWAARRLGDG